MAYICYFRQGNIAGEIKIGFWNARCLMGMERQESVHQLLETKKVDMLCLSETWFRQDSKRDVFQHEGYIGTCNERSGRARKGGGLMLLI